MSKPRVNARLEHVTRKGERRGKSRRQPEPKKSSWQDRLEETVLKGSVADISKKIDDDTLNDLVKQVGEDFNKAVDEANDGVYAAAAAAKDQPLPRMLGLDEQLRINELERLKRKVLEQKHEMLRLEAKLYQERADKLLLEAEIFERKFLPVMLKEER